MRQKKKGWRKKSQKMKNRSEKIRFHKSCSALLFALISVLHCFFFLKKIYRTGKHEHFCHLRLCSTVIFRDEAESVFLFWKLDRQITFFPSAGLGWCEVPWGRWWWKMLFENNPSWKEMEKRLRLAKDSLTSFLKCLRRWTFPRRLQMINVYQKIIREPLLCYL